MFKFLRPKSKTGSKAASSAPAADPPVDQASAAPKATTPAMPNQSASGAPPPMQSFSGSQKFFGDVTNNNISDSYTETFKTVNKHTSIGGNVHIVNGAASAASLESLASSLSSAFTHNGENAQGYYTIERDGEAPQRIDMTDADIRQILRELGIQMR